MLDITHNNYDDHSHKENVFLFPSMLDQYQIQLTRYLEAEMYEDAKKLLQFLLSCQGEERMHYTEWSRLLEWLETAFPEGESVAGVDESEDDIRRQIFSADAKEKSRSIVKEIMDILTGTTAIEQQLLALERATFVEQDEMDEQLMQWIQSKASIHPIVQFKALQCLKKRGLSDTVLLHRMDEIVSLEIEDTPLGLHDFPEIVKTILDRTILFVESEDVTLPHFATELWLECLQYIYGSTSYNWMLQAEDQSIDCYSAALHLTLHLIVYGQAEDDSIREIYGITEECRFRYEQACRFIRSVAMLLQAGE